MHRQWITAAGTALIAASGLTAAAVWLGTPPTAVAVKPANVATPLLDSPAASEILIGRCYDSEKSGERPSQVLYGCDGTGVMKNMSWSRWGASGADGTGVSDETDCVPDCAGGRRTTYPIVVHAANPIMPGGTCPSGVQFYKDLIVAYPKAAPPGVESSGPDFVRYNGMPAVHYDDTPRC